MKTFQDAETVLSSDKHNIRAIYQKAEALYFLGQFELSLMFFHRGLRLRPELNNFRLGVQKTQEAIEKTIGGFKGQKGKSSKKQSIASIPTTASTTFAERNRQPSQNTINTTKSTSSSASKLLRSTATVERPKTRPKTSKISVEKREAKSLLGELCVDKEYLEKLLKHPNLKRADTGTEQVSSLVNDAVRFLNTRQEFWRQQRPCTALPSKKNLSAQMDSSLPKWY